jgi:hypothetical protein
MALEHHSNRDQRRRIRSLLRDEIAAAETYRQVIEHVPSPAQWRVLVGIQRDHRYASERLRELLHHQPNVPSANAPAEDLRPRHSRRPVDVTIDLLGDAGTLQLLRIGEEASLDDYHHLLDEDIGDELRSFIASTLLPRCERHLSTLDQLTKAS